MDETVKTAPSPIYIAWLILKKNPLLTIPIVFLIGIIIRIIFLPNPGFEADVSFWKSWGLAVYDHGIVWGIKNTNNNYPTAFAYVLGLMTSVYSIFADPHNFNDYWNNHNILFLTISKMPAVLSDIGIFGLILWIGKRAAKLHFPELPYSMYIIVASVIFLNPITIIDGSWWGQVDSVGVIVFLVAFLFAIKRMPFLAGLIYMASMMTKLQNMVYGPVFFVFLWQVTGFSGLLQGIAGAIAGFVGYNWEFFLAREMKLVFEQLTVNYDYFPFMSLNAYNLWWIVAKANGMHVLDKFTVLGMLNAKTVGLFMFSASYLFAVIIMTKETLLSMVKKTLDPFHIPDMTILIYRFFTAMIIVNAAFFLFQTESHDRYAFPVVVYLPLWCLFFMYHSTTKKDRLELVKTKMFRWIVIFFGLFTILYFYNLHNAMVDNYPQNGLPFVKNLNIDGITLIAAYLQLGLFAVFLWAITRHISAGWYTIPLLFIALTVGGSNIALLTKSPVPINKFTPLISQQGYGKRQKDMPVNASDGFNRWSYMSDMYMFYRHGIGTHAKSYHQYNINGQFRKFTTDFGIDTEAGTNASATFEIYGDDRPLYLSPKVGRFDMPHHIEVDVTGVKMLGLVTNDASDGINDDHTDWLNPLLWP